jgi:uncharacterized protein
MLHEHMANLVLFASEALMEADPANDFHHVELAMRMAERLCDAEGADHLVVKAALLIHNIAPRKRIDGRVSDYREESLQKGAEALKASGFPQEIIPTVLNCVEAAYFGNELEAVSIEAKVAHDANKLVTMGALAIARTFTYGGFFRRPIYDPKKSFIQSRDDISQVVISEYDPYSIDPDSVSHFRTKLLRIKNTMMTNTGKMLAEKRHEFMVKFLNQLFDEMSCQE